MARESVKNLQETRDLAQQVNQAFMDADSSMLGVLNKVSSVSDGLLQSNLYSEKNLQAARETTDAMSSVVALAQANTTENKKAVETQLRAVLASKNLGKNQKELLQDLLEEVSARNSNVEAANALDEHKGKVMAITMAVGVVSAAFASVVAIATSLGEKVDQVGNAFGAVAGDNAFRESFLAADAEAIRLGLSINEVLSVTDQLTSKFGIDFTPEVAKSAGFILDFAKGAGISNDEATNLVGTLTAVTDLTVEQASQLGQGVFNLAKQANVAPVAVLRDLASSGEIFAQFSGGSADNLARAAIEARALGTNLDEVASAARQSLNFADSLRAETEASVLLGRQVNLQRARELAQSKDLAGFQTEIVKQLGSQQEFLDAPIQAQEALAAATGFSVERIAELLDNSEKVESLSNRLAGGPTFAELVGDEALSEITKFLNLLKQTVATVLQELEPAFATVGEKLTGIVEELGGAKGIANSLAGAFEMAVSAVGKIATNLPTIIGLMTSLKVLSVGFAIAQSIAAIATAAGKSFGIGGLAVLGVLTGAAAAVSGLVASSIASFHDLEEGTMAVATATDSPVNMTTGEAVARIEDINRPAEVMVHADNSDVVEAIKSLVLDVKVSRNDLQFILNSGAGV